MLGGHQPMEKENVKQSTSMLTDKQMSYLNHRMAGYVRKMDYDYPTWEKWAQGNLDHFTFNNLLKSIKDYEDTWDEIHLDSFKGQVKELYERRENTTA